MANEAADIFNDFALNEDAESQGVFVPYKGDVEFLIARNGNRAYKKKIAHNYKKNARLLDSGTDAAEAKSEAIIIEVMAESILLGWKGTVAMKGVVLPYTKDNAKKLLAIPLFREWVSKQAEDFEAYKAVQEAEDAKN